MDLTVIDNAETGDIAEWIASTLAAALNAQPQGIAVAFPGGTTAFPIIEALGKHALDWPRVAVWAGDDRIVPEDHPASNTGRIRAILEPLGATVVSLTEAAEPPHFALVWLGMGADGHIASLFPNTEPQVDDAQKVRRLTPDPLPPEAPFERLTLTIPALLDSDRILFVIKGDEKRRVFQAAVAGINRLPVARLLAAAEQKVICFT